MKKIRLDIEGMHCQSCVTLLTKALQKDLGVKYVNVNLTTEKATIEFDESKTNETQLINIIKSLNYNAKISTGDNFSIII